MTPAETSQRIVVKVGSQVLCDEHGVLDENVIQNLARQISELVGHNAQLLLVSSGAVSSGAGVAAIEPGAARVAAISNPVARKQALAALGQVRLMETWQRYLASHQLAVAQVLATRSDFQSRRHYLNMRSCLEALLDAGVIPIVNENDVVSVTELMFTDNDELAGLLAGMIGADLLCLLSSVDGVYDSKDQPGQPVSIAEWDDSKHQVEDIVLRGTSALGRGGMHSKIAVARKAAGLGTEVVIANGATEDVLAGIFSGRPVGTRFPASGEVSPAKRWLANAQFSSAGSVKVNPGAEEALQDRTRLASLLPIGITAIDGKFEQGDVIEIRNEQDEVIGCGRARYDHAEAARLKGLHGQKPLIHYDYLYLVD